MIDEECQCELLFLYKKGPNVKIEESKGGYEIINSEDNGRASPLKISSSKSPCSVLINSAANSSMLEKSGLF